MQKEWKYSVSSYSNVGRDEPNKKPEERTNQDQKDVLPGQSTA
jgi:hypothetical protein